MAPRPVLKLGAFVFFLPEQLSSSSDTAQYGRVTELTESEVIAQILESQESIRIPIDTAKEVVVSKREATQTQTKRIVRQAVTFSRANRHWHGQVISVEGNKAHVQLRDRIIVVPVKDLTIIAPITALLLQSAHLSTEDISSSMLSGIHNSILDRVLGFDDNPPTTGISEILHGLIPEIDHPTSDSRREWIEPSTGIKRSFRLQHAVDFTFAIDGENTDASVDPDSLGPSFCHEPEPCHDQIVSAPTVTPIRHDDSTSVANQSGMDSFFGSDDDESTSETEQNESHAVGRSSTRRHMPSRASKRHKQSSNPVSRLQNPSADSHSVGSRALQWAPPTASSANVAAQTPPSSAPPHVAQQSIIPDSRASTLAPSADSEILTSLISRPDLLAHYVRLLEQHEPPSRQGALPAAHTVTPVASKYSFNPSESQRAVHNAITAHHHKGKHPSVFVESLPHASAIRFQPHPGILSRLYSFEFGILGLSILHFAPFGMQQRMEWLNSGGCNMQNFSASINAPRTHPATIMGAVIDAVRSLARYAQEFLIKEVQDMIDHLLDMLFQLDDWHVWHPDGLKFLVNVIDSVLGAFRASLHTSGDVISACSATKLRLTVSDSEFQNVIHMNSRSEGARRASTQYPHHQSAGQSRPHYNRPQSIGVKAEGAQRLVKIPKHIYSLIPEVNNREVCLRYLSNLGCSTQVTGPCPVPQSRESASTKSQSIREAVSVDLIQVQRIQKTLLQRLRRDQATVQAALTARIGANYSGPRTAGIDKNCQHTISWFVRKTGSSLPDLVRILRGETARDPRPNKALDPERLQLLLQGYKHSDIAVQIAREGIKPRWIQGSRGIHSVPTNHKSAATSHRAVLHSIGKGQQKLQYLVVDKSLLEQWPEVRCSPFGAVEKKDVDPQREIRLIHDLSFPRGASTNDFFDKTSAPEIEYTSVAVIARRIEFLAEKYPTKHIKIKKGDVKGAFRNLMVNADHVHWMGATIGDSSLVIDLAAPFGWSGSPPFYSVFGRAITWLVQTNSPASIGKSEDTEPFFGFEWVDDHVLVEPDIEDRLQLAEVILRLSMLAVLGPESINEEKFSEWESELQALGLVWNTRDLTVSMPQEKINKCLSRVTELLVKGSASKIESARVLGSLRHISLCLRATKPFYQRLHTWSLGLPPFGRRRLSQTVRDDLNWFTNILKYGRLERLPLRFFGQLPKPDVHFYMDASNIGLVVLNPALQQYIQVKFNEHEVDMINMKQEHDQQHDFSINVREHFCVALAMWVWGEAIGAGATTMPHIRCWSDNSSAVSWSNSLASTSHYAQEINRAIGLAEATFRVRVSVEHLPGSINRMADAGSRTGPDALEKTLQDILINLQSESLAASSKQRYQQTWRQWCAWCNVLQYNPWLTNNSSEGSLQLALFAVHCFKYGFGRSANGNSVATIISKLSQISWYHRIQLGYPVKLLPHHTLAIRGMQRAGTPPTTKSPVTIEILRAIRRRLNFNIAHDRVMWGATVMGFFFLLRRSEYLAKGHDIYRFAIRRDDVSFVDKHGRTAYSRDTIHQVCIRFRGGKNDQAGQGTIRTLSASSKSWCCPLKAVWALAQNYDSHSSNQEDLLCKITATDYLQARDLAKAIKVGAQDSGADPTKYSLHSLRIGGATALFSAGVSPLVIKLFGRWRSTTFERYTRIEDRATTTMAQQMVSRGSNHSIHQLQL